MRFVRPTTRLKPLALNTAWNNPHCASDGTRYTTRPINTSVVSELCQLLKRLRLIDCHF